MVVIRGEGRRRVVLLSVHAYLGTGTDTGDFEA
jgi:hypothetical protein